MQHHETGMNNVETFVFEGVALADVDAFELNVQRYSPDIIMFSRYEVKSTGVHTSQEEDSSLSRLLWLEDISSQHLTPCRTVFV